MANASDFFASVNVLKHTLIKILKAAMTQSLPLSDGTFNRTKMEAMGSSDARIHMIQDVIFRTSES